EGRGGAAQLTRSTALSAIEPDLRDSLLRGDAAARRRLDNAVHTRVLRSPVVRVKLWTRDGRIAYSDAPGLIGRRFALDDPELRAFRARQVDPHISNRDRAATIFERGLGN